jgi:hypothetical protein
MKILAFRAHKNDLLSAAIMAETRSRYCHGAVLLESTEETQLFPDREGTPGKHVIVEEFWPRARARWLEADELEDIDVFDLATGITVPEFHVIPALQYARRQIDNHLAYDWEDLPRFVAPLRAILGEAADDAARRHQFCSMFVYNIYLAGGVRLLNCHDYECSPDKLDWSPYVVPAPALNP